MPRRRAAVSRPDPPDPPDPPGNARLPRIVFLLLCVLVLALGILEVRNRLLRPLLWRVPDVQRRAPALALYQTGGVAERTAWVLHEGTDGATRPQLIQRILCNGKDNNTGDLHWTADGRAVYAIHRERRTPEGGPAPLWCFEFETGRMFIRDPAFAVPGALSILEKASGLTQRLWDHGGPGGKAVSWYEMGGQGMPLWFWQTARWERALPREQ